MAWLAERGVAVAQLELEPKPGRMFIEMLDCYRELERAALAEAAASLGPLGLVVYSGFSGGATVALSLARKGGSGIPAKKRMVISLSGYTAFPKAASPKTILDRYRVEAEYFYPKHRKAFQSVIGQSAGDRARNIEAASPETFVDSSYPLLLLVHGTDDRIVSFNQSVKLYRQAKRLGCDATLVLLDGAGHDETMVANSARAQIKAFIGLDRSDSRSRRKFSGKVSIRLPGRERMDVYRSFLQESNPARDWFSSFPGARDPLVSGFPGSVARHVFYSRAMKSDVSYYIHLPEEPGEDALPLLIHCPPHVVPARQHAWEFVTPRYHAMQSGMIPKFAIVVVDHLFYGTTREQRASERMIVSELLPHLKRAHPVSTERKDVVIEGGCEAGLVALKVGLRHPGLFSSIIATNPHLDDELRGILMSVGGRQGALPEIRIEVGEADSLRVPDWAMGEFVESLRTAGAKVDCVRFEHGGHGSLEVLLSDPNVALRHYIRRFGARRWEELAPDRVIPFEGSNPNYRIDCVRAATPSDRYVIWIPGADWRGDYFRNGHSRENCRLRRLKSLPFNLYCFDYANLDYSSFEEQLKDISNAIHRIYTGIENECSGAAEIILCGETSGAYFCLRFLGGLSDSSWHANLAASVRRIVFLDGLFDVSEEEQEKFSTDRLFGTMPEFPRIEGEFRKGMPGSGDFNTPLFIGAPQLLLTTRRALPPLRSQSVAYAERIEGREGVVEIGSISGDAEELESALLNAFSESKGALLVE